MTKSGTHRSQALDEDRGTEYTFQQLQKVSSRFSSPSVQQPCRLSEPTANTTPLIRTHARCPRASKIDWATGYTTNIIRTYRLDVRLSEEKSTDCELSLSLSLSRSLSARASRRTTITQAEEALSIPMHRRCPTQSRTACLRALA